VAFIAGGLTSMLSGLIGMKVAVFSNARTTVMAAGDNAWTNAFNCAFRAGSVMVGGGCTKLNPKLNPVDTRSLNAPGLVSFQPL
jgi:hypothetical protein